MHYPSLNPSRNYSTRWRQILDKLDDRKLESANHKLSHRQNTSLDANSLQATQETWCSPTSWMSCVHLMAAGWLAVLHRQAWHAVVPALHRDPHHMPHSLPWDNECMETQHVHTSGKLVNKIISAQPPRCKMLGGNVAQRIQCKSHAGGQGVQKPRANSPVHEKSPEYQGYTVPSWQPSWRGQGLASGR